MPVSISTDGAPTTNAAGPSGPPSGTWRMLAGQEVNRSRIPKGLDALWDNVSGRFAQAVPRRARLIKRAERIVALGEKRFASMGQEALREAVEELRVRFRRVRETREEVDLAFAAIREVAWRQMGLKPYPNQVAAALAMHQGEVAEMATGEGKTLSATMPALLAGWRGHGCHVLTVNDYLAGRDAEYTRPVYRFCGLTVAHVEESMAPPERREAYRADITYTTNKEVAADFLRDRLTLGRDRGLTPALLNKLSRRRGMGADGLVMRGLEHAIVDEADSVLVDEAVTPLIISGEAPNPEQTETFVEAAEIARAMEPGRDYRVNHRYREVELTDAGYRRMDAWRHGRGGLWKGARRSEELVLQALSARELFIRDSQYVIQDEKVVIVDDFTGRLMPDRTWRNGLHQAVEAKEGLEIQPPKETLARVSFQRFFRLYRSLAGMTGTAWEARGELWQIYGMPVVRIPTHRPVIRKQLPDRIFATAEAKWRAVVEEIRRVHATGQPVLVGTRSVEASEHVQSRLEAAGIDCRVLNAVRHEEEASIVADAGQKGHVTVATNMAGRGTDIKLGPGVAELGGLHVIATERHESGRIDRQLFGRSGRQGDPGSAVAFMSLDDELTERYAPAWRRNVLRRLGRQEFSTERARRLFERAQHRAEKLALTQRKGVMKTDDWLDEFLGFAGRDV